MTQRYLIPLLVVLVDDDGTSVVGASRARLVAGKSAHRVIHADLKVVLRVVCADATASRRTAVWYRSSIMVCAGGEQKVNNTSFDMIKNLRWVVSEEAAHDARRWPDRAVMHLLHSQHELRSPQHDVRFCPIANALSKTQASL